MLVQNCPDKDLSLVFKSKAVRSWTACEVQERLDEFLRERKAKKCHVKQNAMRISEESQESVDNNCQTNSSHNSNSCEPEQAPSILEKTTLDRVLNMLEKALDVFRLSCELPEANRACEAVPCDVLHSQRADPVLGDTAGRLSREEVSAVLVTLSLEGRCYSESCLSCAASGEVDGALRNQVMKRIHDEAGHQGQQRTLWLGRQRCYWDSMGKDIKEGANFESSLIAELLLLAGVSKSHTTPYHPMGNGQAERFNRTLGNMIRTLPPRSKAKWPQLLNTLTFAYTVHETTGFPPFFLMFGRTPRLPVDVVFESVLLDDVTVDVGRYVQSLGENLREAMSLAQMHAKRQQNKQAENYNRNCKGQSLDVGDRVLLVNKGERGKKKLADHWENTVYVVVSTNDSLNIYRIRNCSTGRTKTVHRNLLMPVNFLPVPSWGESGKQGSYSSDSISHNMLKIDGQTDLCNDRTTQWVADLQDTPEVGQIEDTEDWCEKRGRGSLDFEDGAGTQRRMIRVNQS
ncbi:hypothetical protein SRHO_G00054340 [Serrasalmus rhombeus]